MSCMTHYKLKKCFEDKICFFCNLNGAQIPQGGFIPYRIGENETVMASACEKCIERRKEL